MSVAEYRRLGETDERYELVDGRLVMTPRPRPFHQLVAMRLGRQLAAHLPDGWEVLPEVDWEVDELNVRVPDIAVVSSEQAHSAWLSQPPLMTVEVLSPSTREVDLVTKRQLYGRGGVAHYWIVDPETRELAAERNVGGASETTSSASTGGALTVEEPFPVTVDVDGLFA